MTIIDSIFVTDEQITKTSLRPQKPECKLFLDKYKIWI